MLIEVVGASGAGKSTIIRRALTQRSKPSPEWLAPREAAQHFDSIPQQVRRGAVDDPEIVDFIQTTLQTVAATTMLPSQKVSALGILTRSEFMRQAIRGCMFDVPVVHDELLLNRAFSLLLYSQHLEEDAVKYFQSVPLPEAVVIVDVSPETLVEHLAERARPVNVYTGLDSRELSEVAHRATRLADIGATVLKDRNLPLLRIEGDVSPEQSGERLHTWIRGQANSTRLSVPPPWSRLLEVSDTFHKASGRHKRRHPDVAYCSFHTRRFSVLRHQAQRDAVSRIERFGLTPSFTARKSVLDLGSYTGAMLLQLTNMGIKRGLGIEYDEDKVELAQDIAELSQLRQVEFQQGDVDVLTASELGTFDLVFCLAIEAHVKDPERLYALLGEVTGEHLYFEGNDGCDLDQVTQSLKAVGFTEFELLALSDDDIDPANHSRPIMVASK